jgi:hypothetical protein
LQCEFDGLSDPRDPAEDDDVMLLMMTITPAHDVVLRDVRCLDLIARP